MGKKGPDMVTETMNVGTRGDESLMRRVTGYVFGALLAVCSLSGFAGEWAYYGQDAGGARYASLDQINRDNVAQLERAWTYRTGVSSRRPGPTACAITVCSPPITDSALTSCLRTRARPDSFPSSETAASSPPLPSTASTGSAS